MGKWLVAAAALICWSPSAVAQDGGYGGGDVGAMPSIILPEQLTSPITGDFNPQDGGHPQSGDTANSEGGESLQAPYSVEGEETLDPETN